MLPSNALHPNVAAAAVAVMRGARTVREVGAACGWTSSSTASLYLTMAKAEGLVTWESGRSGTMRPAVGVVIDWG